MISEAQKDEIKRAPANCDPCAVVAWLGLDATFKDPRKRTKPRAGDALVRCPWHQDSNPSCSITRGPDGTLRAHCFTCDNGGDVFSLLAAARQKDVARDFAALANEAAEHGRVSVEDAQRQGREPRPAPVLFAPVEPLPIGPGDRAFGALVTPLLHLGALDGGPVSVDVCAYLAARSMLEVAIAEGWAALPPAGSIAAASWCRMLRAVAPDIARALDVDGRDVASELAEIIASDSFHYAEHRLVIPLRAPCGTIYTWQRRALDGRPRKYVFPDGGRETKARDGRGRGARWPYGVERLAAAAKGSPIVFTEGALDAGAVRAIDAAKGRERVVLGVAGTGAWCDYFATLASGRAAAVATDADEADRHGKRAGDDAAKKWGAALWRGGAVDVQRERPVGAKDWSAALAAARSGGSTA